MSKLRDYINWTPAIPSSVPPLEQEEEDDRMLAVITTIKAPAVAPLIGVEEVRSITERLRAMSTLPLPIMRPKASHTSPDYTVWLVLVIASITSICATIYYYEAHEILLYKDAVSHLRIGRSVFDSLTPGFAQLGTSWLPLPHILSWLFVWNDALWYNGLAGSFEAMLCYILACIFLFLILRRITQNIWASLIGTSIFLANPNILYLQSTPLSELVCIMCYAWVAYTLLCWLENPTFSKLVHLSCATFLVTLSRYDGWFLFGTVWIIVGLAHILWHTKKAQIEAELIVFTIVAISGIVLWLLWNTLISGDPLYFQHSLYSSQTNQLPFRTAGYLYTYHNFWQSLRFYTITAIEDAGVGIALASSVGFALYIFRGWRETKTLFALIALAPVAFYTISLYTGQAIIWIPQANPIHTYVYMFNTRYGTQMIFPMAIFCGILSWHLMSIPWGKYSVPVLCITMLSIQIYFIMNQGVITLQEGQYDSACPSVVPQTFTKHGGLATFGEDISSPTVFSYLQQHWNGGLIMENIFTTRFDGSESDIEFKNIIYEGSYQIWPQALAHPEKYAEWIIVNPTNSNDLIAQHIHVSSKVFLAHYRLVLIESGGLRLYQQIGSYTLANRPTPPTYVYSHVPCSLSY